MSMIWITACRCSIVAYAIPAAPCSHEACVLRLLVCNFVTHVFKLATLRWDTGRASLVCGANMLKRVLRLQNLGSQGSGTSGDPSGSRRGSRPSTSKRGLVRPSFGRQRSHSPQAIRCPAATSTTIQRVHHGTRRDPPVNFVLDRSKPACTHPWMTDVGSTVCMSLWHLHQRLRAGP